MEIAQNNKLKMAQTTLACLQDNATVWTGIKGIEEATTTATEIVDAILERSLKQSARTGFAEMKTVARDTMLAAAFKVGSGLRSLSAATEDSQLFVQADFSRSSLARGREAEVINRCQSLLKLGNQNADALGAKYNVVANDLKALKKAIEDFTTAQPKPRQGISASASATAELAELFTQLDGVLNHQLDSLVETFETINPAFYNEYQTARAIVDSSASHAGKPAPAPAPAPLAHAA